MSDSRETATASDQPKKKSAITIPSLVLNVVIPVVILVFLSGDDQLGPVFGLLVALSLPLGYGFYDLLKRRNINFFSTLGIVGILWTAGIGLLKVDVQWFAIRQLVVPVIMALVIIVSLKTRLPVVKTFLNSIVDLDKVYEALREQGTVEAFEKRLRFATYFAAGSFLFSGIVNYILAKVIVESPAGTPDFNQEVGKMIAIELPVLGIPFTIMLVMTVRYVLVGIRRLSGLRPKSVVR